jgi:hypothetical protein
LLDKLSISIRESQKPLSKGEVLVDLKLLNVKDSAGAGSSRLCGMGQNSERLFNAERHSHKRFDLSTLPEKPKSVDVSWRSLA